jgi:hypothetical protein
MGAPLAWQIAIGRAAEPVGCDRGVDSNALKRCGWRVTSWRARCSRCMRPPSEARNNLPRWAVISIPASAGFFLFALFVSAAFQPSLRWLHGFQALIYVAIILLSRQNSAWGFGAGVFIGAFWNFIFLRGASRDIGALLSGGAFRADVALQLAAAMAQFLLIAACLNGIWRKRRDPRVWVISLAAGVLAVGFLVALMVILRPQYLPMLQAAFGLHP